jgi:hypothetical protein
VTVPTLVVAAVLALSPASKPACLHYEPELVHLWGVLERVASPDRAQAAWILRLPDPICTTGPADVNKPERDVREIELVARGPMAAQFAPLEGSKVTATGTLFHAGARSGREHTAVLMAVKGLAARGPRAAAVPPSTPAPAAASSALSSSKPGDALDAVIRDLDTRLPPSSARELAAIQARWQELAERDCRWEVSLSEGGADTPDAYTSCIERARLERARRLKEIR